MSNRTLCSPSTETSHLKRLYLPQFNAIKMREIGMKNIIKKLCILIFLRGVLLLKKIGKPTIRKVAL